MIRVRTNEALLRALRSSASVKLTPEEVHQQRISFIMSTLNDESNITRAKVEEILDKQIGRK